MPIITNADVDIGYRPDAVICRVPIDGRKRIVVIDRDSAIQIANRLATAAVDIAATKDVASLTAVSIALKPYDSSGNANLAIVTAEHGPFIVTIDAEQLTALSQAAAAALELAKPSGEA